MVALAVLPVLKVTRTVLPRAPVTTWLLVRIAPSAVNTTPEPSPVPVLMSTTLCAANAAMLASDERSMGAAACSGRCDEVPVAGLPESYRCTAIPPATPDTSASTSAADSVPTTRAALPPRCGSGSAGPTGRGGYGPPGGGGCGGGCHAGGPLSGALLTGTPVTGSSARWTGPA